MVPPGRVRFPGEFSRFSRLTWSEKRGDTYLGGVEFPILRGQQVSVEPHPPPEGMNHYAQWLKLDELRQRKIITEAEYQKQRRALLDELE